MTDIERQDCRIIPTDMKTNKRKMNKASLERCRPPFHITVALKRSLETMTTLVFRGFFATPYTVPGGEGRRRTPQGIEFPCIHHFRRVGTLESRQQRRH